MQNFMHLGVTSGRGGSFFPVRVWNPPGGVQNSMHFGMTSGRGGPLEKSLNLEKFHNSRSFA